ncbi:hypothetical protein Vwe01_60240 [Micromonospora andamanensis]|nr:hypothetical protein Vwe01_60240 [Micromonospora andamanensis]
MASVIDRWPNFRHPFPDGVLDRVLALETGINEVHEHFNQGVPCPLGMLPTAGHDKVHTGKHSGERSGDRGDDGRHRSHPTIVML